MAQKLSREDIRNVGCPECGACAGTHCVTNYGTAKGAKRLRNHTRRVRRAYAEAYSANVAEDTKRKWKQRT